MKWRPSILYLAVVVFFLSAVAVMYSLERASMALAVIGAGGMGVAALLFLASLFLPRRRVDWERIEAEQRLWESGPLGRSWLRIRQRLSNLWKL
ncbi:hypothetical protein BH23GEM3_BH23GEM3_02910 [soil metagenome]|nr:hypothetical protein [Gemmatimonadota bacterium]